MTRGNSKINPLGPQVRALRRQCHISQLNLAKDLGIDQGHYSKLERGAIPDRKSYLRRAIALLKGQPGKDTAVDAIVMAASKKIRTSPSFRRLIEAALAVRD